MDADRTLSVGGDYNTATVSGELDGHQWTRTRLQGTDEELTSCYVPDGGRAIIGSRPDCPRVGRDVDSHDPVRMTLYLNHLFLCRRVPYRHQPVLRAGYDTLAVLGHSNGEDFTPTHCCPHLSTICGVPVSKRAFVPTAYDSLLVPQEGNRVYGVAAIDFDDFEIFLQAISTEIYPIRRLLRTAHRRRHPRRYGEFGCRSEAVQVTRQSPFPRPRAGWWWGEPG